MTSPLACGQIVHADGVCMFSSLDRLECSSCSATADDEPTEPDPPAKSAIKPEWVAFAVARGADPEEAEAATKDDLIDTYTQESTTS